VSILAIDQGTSGTKAIVVDDSGVVVSIAEVNVRPDYLPGGGVEQDPLALLDSVITAGQRALAESGIAVSGVALANQGETVLTWDPKSGAPLSPAIVWQDSRSASVCERISDHSEELSQRTGLVLDPYFSAPKMRWLRDQGFTEGVVTTSDTWLLHQLTGAFVTDVSTASRSLILDLDSRTWDPGLLEIFGLSGEALPRIADCDEVVGSTRAFGAELAVGGTVVDQQAALLAENCLSAGAAKCTYGTGAFLLVNTGSQAPRSTNGLTTSVAWTIRGQSQYCLDGQVFTAASAVRWIQELGLLTDAVDLDAAAAQSSEGVHFVPALAGLAAPWWRSDATASFAGLRLASGRGNLIRAVIEGIAAQVTELARACAADLGKPLQTLRVDGGLTQSRVLMQAQADLLQLPISVYPSAHATALGAARLGQLAIDPSTDLLSSVWTPEQIYEPQWSADRAHDFMSRWSATVQRSLSGNAEHV